MKNIKNRILMFMLIGCMVCMLIPMSAMASGEVTASVTAVDAASKTVTVTLSENVEGSPGGVYLYNTESGDSIDATASVKDLNKIVIEYKKALAPNTEHAVVFKGDVYGVSGSALNSRYLYFTTEDTSAPEETTVFDYDTKSTTASGYQSNWAAADSGDADHGKAMHVTAYALDGNMDNDLGNISYYTADKWSVSFDVKIVKNPPAFGILLFGENNTTPTSFGFSKSRAMFRDNFWWSFDQLGTDIDRWFADSIFSDYKIGQWVNYKAVYDKNANVFSIYEDGVYKLSVTPSKPFNKLTKIRISMRNQNVRPAQGETLIWLDNLTLEKYPTVSKVEKIRVTDLSGKSVAAPQTTKRDIEKIDIGFLAEVNKATLTKDTMKLSYNGKSIDYTIVDTYNDKTCTIIPASLPENGDKLILSISGVKDKKGNTLLDYSTAITVEDEETGFVASAVKLTAPDGSDATLTSGGEIYLKASFANKSSEDKEVVAFITGYSNENSLEALGCQKIIIPANSILNIDNVQNSVKMMLPPDGSVTSVMGSVNVVVDNALVPVGDAAVLMQGE